MFSGGEKKSFYELSIVIGTGIIALELKINRFTSQRIFYFSVASASFTLKVVRSSVFFARNAYFIPACFAIWNMQ